MTRWASAGQRARSRPRPPRAGRGGRRHGAKALVVAQHELERPAHVGVGQCLFLRVDGELLHLRFEVVVVGEGGTEEVVELVLELGDRPLTVSFLPSDGDLLVDFGEGRALAPFSAGEGWGADVAARAGEKRGPTARRPARAGAPVAPPPPPRRRCPDAASCRPWACRRWTPRCGGRTRPRPRLPTTPTPNRSRCR